MSLRVFLSIMVAACAATAQKYDGPKPPKPDLPYIKHADKLLATEAIEAKTQKKKDDTLYTVDGANSSAKTPLAAPVLLFESAKINPANLQLFRMESKDGHREFVVRASDEPIRIESPSWATRSPRLSLTTASTRASMRCWPAGRTRCSASPCLKVGPTIGFCRRSTRRIGAKSDRPQRAMVCPAKRVILVHSHAN